MRVFTQKNRERERKIRREHFQNFDFGPSAERQLIWKSNNFRETVAKTVNNHQSYHRELAPLVQTKWIDFVLLSSRINSVSGSKKLFIAKFNKKKNIFAIEKKGGNFGTVKNPFRPHLIQNLLKMHPDLATLILWKRKRIERKFVKLIKKHHKRSKKTTGTTLHSQQQRQTILVAKSKNSPDKSTEQSFDLFARHTHTHTSTTQTHTTPHSNASKHPKSPSSSGTASTHSLFMDSWTGDARLARYFQ